MVNRCVVAWKALCGKFEREFISAKDSEKNAEYQNYEVQLESIFEKFGLSRIEGTNQLLEKAETFHLKKKGNLFPGELDGSQQLAEICYWFVRLLKPSIVVETGVSRGVTSVFILKALDANRKGNLYSIELPHLRQVIHEDIGIYIPNNLKSRWKLILGSGIREIQKLQKKILKIDMFVHDSNHSYVNQLAEYRLAWPWLNERGVLISDDVKNSAFMEFCAENSKDPYVIKQGKESGFVGILGKL